MIRRERLERKLALRQQWAGKAAERSDARFAAAHSIADAIPFGQPILVGHHSERHARRDADRIHSNMSKAVELSKLSQHHEQCAAGIESALDRSIFSDDSDAVQQLEARIAEHEAKRERMKLVNKLFKKGDSAGLKALGLDLEQLKTTLAQAGPYWGSRPHLAYELSNVGGRITADRKRLEQVKLRQSRTAAAESAPNGVTLENCNSGYVRVTFAEKPDREILDALRGAGFFWGAGSWAGKAESLPDSVKALCGDQASEPEPSEPVRCCETVQVGGRDAHACTEPASEVCTKCGRGWCEDHVERGGVDSDNICEDCATEHMARELES